MKWLARLIARRAERKAKQETLVAVVRRSGISYRQRAPEIERWFA